MPPKRKAPREMLGVHPTHPTRWVSSSDPESSPISGPPLKRLFRLPKNKQGLGWIPTQQRPAEMSDLLTFITKHEEAFNDGRLASLYADFRGQREINFDGYRANINFWIKALADAARAGKIPAEGSTHDLLTIRTSEHLLRALTHPRYGRPPALPAVFQDATANREFMPKREFLDAKTSIYHKSWVPSAWDVVQWGLRATGLVAEPNKDAVQFESFVVVKNIEVAGNEILKAMKDKVFSADRILSYAEFSKRFSNAINPGAPLTADDLKTVLVHLIRDKQAIAYNGKTIKFKADSELVPQPVTQEDDAIVKMRETHAKIDASLGPLNEKILLATAAAKEALKEKNYARAKAALRSKKLAESAFAERTNVVIQLEATLNKLHQAADQVAYVKAMEIGSIALKGLHEQVGGAEGVQNTMDALNEQMTTTDEVSNIISETGQPVDEMEIDDELEAMEKAEREKREEEEATKTAARLAELEQAREDPDAEMELSQAEQDLSRLSVVRQDYSVGERSEKEEQRIPEYA